MPHSTQSIAIDAAPDAVFGFVADAENLPRWAAGFAKKVRRCGDDAWTVTTPQGEVRVRLVTDSGLGVVDFHLEPAPGALSVAHSRVVPAADGGAVYAFTQQQAPGMPDAEYARQVETLGRELRLLKSLLEVGSCEP